MKRPIRDIAREIHQAWAPKGVYFGAKPYLDAMFSLNQITDRYGEDPGRQIVAYFLSNATTFRGEEARRLKAELKEHLRA